MFPRRLIILPLLMIAALCLLQVAQAEDGRWKRPYQRQREACAAWCRNNKPLCEKCSPQPNCGGGFRRIKSWTGQGGSVYACSVGRRYGYHSRRQWEVCSAWCRNNKPLCEKCSLHPNCGRGFRRIKSWTGPRGSVYACSLGSR